MIAGQKDIAAAGMRLQQTLDHELTTTRVALLESARAVLPRYLIFGAEHVRELVSKLLAMENISIETLPRRKKSLRARERHLLLFLQRICAKNDTLSEFGPASWGKIVNAVASLSLAPGSGVSMRESFLERWTAHGIALAMNADPAVRPELSPRVHPNGRVEDGHFVFTDAGERVRLNSDTLEILDRCDGRTQAHSLGFELGIFVRLADQKLIRWEVEVPALEPHAFDVLVADVKRWRDGALRARWLNLLEPIAALPAKFIHTTDTVQRMEIMDQARQRLQTLGSERATSDRSLYSAINPIGEECFRDCGFEIAPELINEVATDAAPWIDLWRDNYAFVASRIAAGLRGVLEKMSLKQNAAVPFPAFLRACEEANLSLTGPGLVTLGHIAFQEVKAAFRSRMKPHAAKPEYELTPADCHFIRDSFKYEPFDEYTYPSADLQLAAESVEAVGRGEYQWILAELHPPVALLHHGFYWCCPDKEQLSESLAATTFGRPHLHFGLYVADFTATTAVHLFDAPPGSCNFVAPQRGNPVWPTVRPADAEVYVDETSGDVCVRKLGSREYLGSLARGWIIPLGFHPFQFGMEPQMPRLRCGKVIVQRRAWVIRQDEFGAGNYTGVSRDLILAVERLRAERDLPQFVYIRPTEQALRRSGAEGRDKDTKPVFVDLESYLFMEIFHRWLSKSGELEVTEMLPAPHQLLWREPDGRRTFELRTLIIPSR
ncbi:MAG TPA: hypothetical protein VFO30_06250 [Chthoniobacterales bacterium]|nr:hypothetical protein [Chthoniobacterales bacterium]